MPPVADAVNGSKSPSSPDALITRAVDALLNQEGAHSIDMALPCIDMASLDAPVGFSIGGETPVPPAIQQHFSRAVYKTNVGLHAPLSLLWMAVDDTLYLWNFSNGSHTSIRMDGVVLTCAIGEPRAGVFGDVDHILAVVTESTVSILSLSADSNGVLLIDVLEGNQGGRYSVVVVLKTSWKRAPIDGQATLSKAVASMVTRVTVTKGGRILLWGSSIESGVYELVYQRSPGWVTSRTYLSRHTFTRKGIFGRALGWIMPPSPAAPSTGVPLRAGGKHYQDEIFAVGGSAVDETMVYASVVNGDGWLGIFSLDVSSNGPCESECLGWLPKQSMVEALGRAGAQGGSREVSIHSIAPMTAADGSALCMLFTTQGDRLVVHAHRQKGIATNTLSVVSVSLSGGPDSPALTATGPMGKRRRRLGGDKPFQLSPTTDVVYYNNGLTLVATANDKCVRIGAVGFVPKGEMDAVTSGPFAEYIATVEMRGQVLALGAVSEEVESRGTVGRGQSRRCWILTTMGVSPLTVFSTSEYEFSGPDGLTTAPGESAEEVADWFRALAERGSISTVSAHMWDCSDVYVANYASQCEHAARAGRIEPMHVGRWLKGLLIYLSCDVWPMWSRPILRRAGKKSSKSQIGLGVSVTYASVSDLEVLIGRLKTVGKFVAGVCSLLERSRIGEPFTSSHLPAYKRRQLVEVETTQRDHTIARYTTLVCSIRDSIALTSETLSLLVILQTGIHSGYRILNDHNNDSWIDTLCHTPLSSLIEGDQQWTQSRCALSLLASAVLRESGCSKEVVEAVSRLCPTILGHVDAAAVTAGRPMGAVESDATKELLVVLASTVALLIASTLLQELPESLASLRRLAAYDPKGAFEQLLTKCTEVSEKALKAVLDGAAPLMSNDSQSLTDVLYACGELAVGACPRALNIVLKRVIGTPGLAEAITKIPSANIINRVMLILSDGLHSKAAPARGDLVMDPVAAGELLQAVYVLRGKHVKAATVLRSLSTISSSSEVVVALEQRKQWLQSAVDCLRVANEEKSELAVQMGYILCTTTYVQLPMLREVDYMLKHAPSHAGSMTWSKEATAASKELAGELLPLSTLFTWSNRLRFPQFQMLCVTNSLQQSAVSSDDILNYWVTVCFPPPDGPYCRLSAMPFRKPGDLLGYLLYPGREVSYFMRYDNDEDAVRESSRSSDFVEAATRFCGELCQIAEACRNDTVLRAEIVAAVLEYCYALVREYSGEQDDDDENDNILAICRGVVYEFCGVSLRSLLTIYEHLESTHKTWLRRIRDHMPSTAARSPLHLHHTKVQAHMKLVLEALRLWVREEEDRLLDRRQGLPALETFHEEMNHPAALAGLA